MAHQNGKALLSGDTWTIPETGLTSLRLMNAKIMQAQNEFQAYAQGLLNGLDLQGQWDLDIERGIFVKLEKETSLAHA
jgi:hypothetical protein